jgi:hypothetical protein
MGLNPGDTMAVGSNRNEYEGYAMGVKTADA